MHMAHCRRNNVVIVGYGEIARNQHAPILMSRRSACFDLCAVVDPPLACKKDTSHAPAPIYARLGEAVSQMQQRRGTKIHAVIVSCPPQFAQAYAREALNDYGLSVFMEKPPGFDCHELEELERIARSKNLTLYTGYHSTACPQMENAKAWVQSSVLQLNTIHVEWKESVNKWHPGQLWIKDSIFGVLDILFNPISMLEEILGSCVPMQECELDSTKSSLVIPGNWNGPLSGTSVLSVPKRAQNARSGIDDKATAIACGDSMDAVDIVAEFGWDHKEQDIWKIAFELSDGRRMELHDGGARMISMAKDGMAITQHVGSAVDDPDNVLRPEYERLYDRFVDLLNAKRCEVRVTPLQVAMDILQNSKKSDGEDCSIVSAGTDGTA